MKPLLKKIKITSKNFHFRGNTNRYFSMLTHHNEKQHNYKSQYYE